MTKYTVEYVAEILKNNNWKATKFRLMDGEDIVITPCYYGDGIPTVDDVEYWMVDGDLPWMGNSKLSKVVDDMNNHAKIVEEINKEKAENRKFFEDHEKNGWTDDSWSWYSDWHKDLYGYRPHGHVCGVYVRPY